jgi:hypothetical protein
VDSFPVVSGNTLTGNERNGLEIRGGTLSAATPVVKNWSNTDVVYGLTGHTTIASGVTLVIDPGVMIKFGENKLLGVGGVLKVKGTITNPVYITSLKDDTVGGDTNGDGNATAPDRGDWGHIAFLDTSVDSENLIEHAVIRYGGYFENLYDEYYDCPAWRCEYYGAVRFHSASPTIRNNALTFNRDGIWSRSGSLPTIQSNSICGIPYPSYGVCNEDNTTTVDARYNWWGAPSGPYHPTTNPNGKGVRVSDRVDYAPWITSFPVVSRAIRPGIGISIFSPDCSTSLVFAANAVTETTVVTYTVVPTAPNLPSGLAETGHTFQLEARTATGRPVTPMAQVTIRYTDSDIWNVDENTLALYRWDGLNWVKMTSSLDAADNVLVAIVPAEGTYSMLGQAVYRVYLPLVVKKR